MVEAAEEPEPVEGLPLGLQLVGEAAGVELLQGAGVQDEGPGEVADLLRALLDEGDGDAGGGEVAGQQQAGGAGADDDDGARSGAVHGGLLVPASSGRSVPGQLIANACWSTSVGQRLFANLGRHRRSVNSCWPTLVGQHAATPTGPLWTVNSSLAYVCWHDSEGTPRRHPRRSDATRTAILAAARERFAADGYERATIRAIAKDARIDPSMVMRYYGNKEGLFAAGLDVDLRLPDPRGDRDRTTWAASWCGHFLDLWEQNEVLTAMLRVGVTNDAGAERMQEHLQGPARAGRPARLPRSRAGPDAGRALRVTAARAGAHPLRPALRRPPSALSREEIVVWLAPTVQRYLTAPNP